MGNANSSFHRSMIQHMKHNRFLNLKTKDGNMIHTHEHIEKYMNDYYNNLLEEPRGDKNREIRKITASIPTILNRDHKKMILREVSL